MVQVGDILQGKSGKQYRLGNKLAEGGEGVIHCLDNGTQVAKLFKKSEDKTHRKLLSMMKYQIDLKQPGTGIPFITWPQDIIYQGNTFLGYVMPNVPGGYPIWHMCRASGTKKIFGDQYNWTLALATAANLASLVAHLHGMGITIGDMNSNNIFVHPNGCITIIDVDSFDIRDRDTGEHFKCAVGRPEFLPPELQGRNLTREEAAFNEQTDDFALAVHIFQLLFQAHPFHKVELLDHAEASRTENAQVQHIIKGECPFVRPELKQEIQPGVPHLDKLLPPYLQQDFRNTFFYNDLDSMQRRSSRTKAAVWLQDLSKLYGEKGTNLIQCSRNPKHYYYDFHNGQGCELCRAEQVSNWVLSAGVINSSRADGSTDNPSISSDNTWCVHYSVVNSPLSMEQPLFVRYVYPNGQTSAPQQLNVKTGDEICVENSLRNLGQSQTGTYKVEILNIKKETIASKQFEIIPKAGIPKADIPKAGIPKADIPKPKRSRLGWFVAAMAGFLAIMALLANKSALTDYQGVTNYDLSQLEERNQELRTQNEWMDERIGIIDNGSVDMLYHTYNCSHWIPDRKYEISVYNVELARIFGYRPCPRCH